MIAFYIECFLSSFLGQTISVLLILRSLDRKATAANLQFSISSYFKDDKFIVLANFATILAGLLCLKYILRWQPTWENFFVPAFFLLGYFGSDVPTRLASVANRRLNAAIDYKTTIADQASGLDPKVPTPAVLPNDKTK